MWSDSIHRCSIVETSLISKLIPRLIISSLRYGGSIIIIYSIWHNIPGSIAYLVELGPISLRYMLSLKSSVEIVILTLLGWHVSAHA